MTFKSKAQRRKFEAMVKAGDMEQKTLDEWNARTPLILPERVALKFDDFDAPKVETAKEKKASWKFKKVTPVEKAKKA